VTLDLADLKSVRSLPLRLSAAMGTEEVPAIDVLLNNAGVMAIPERVATNDGFEKTIGVNHLGHFALVGALLPSLKRASDGFRVINVSSDAHKLASKEAIGEALQANLDPPDYSAWGTYGVSKAANVLFTVELQSRLQAAGVKGSAVALHPGLVQTDLPRYVVGGVAAEDTRLSETTPPPTGAAAFLKASLLDPFVIPVELGANTEVFLASGSDSGGSLAKQTATYYDDKMKIGKANEAATDPKLAKKLWEVSEKLTGVQIRP